MSLWIHNDDAVTWLLTECFYWLIIVYCRHWLLHGWNGSGEPVHQCPTSPEVPFPRCIAGNVPRSQTFVCECQRGNGGCRGLLMAFARNVCSRKHSGHKWNCRRGHVCIRQRTPSCGVKKALRSDVCSFNWGNKGKLDLLLLTEQLKERLVKIFKGICP